MTIRTETYTIDQPETAKGICLEFVRIIAPHWKGLALKDKILVAAAAVMAWNASVKGKTPAEISELCARQSVNRDMTEKVQKMAAERTRLYPDEKRIIRNFEIAAGELTLEYNE